jgi:hypothetical protein
MIILKTISFFFLRTLFFFFFLLKGLRTLSINLIYSRKPIFNTEYTASIHINTKTNGSNRRILYSKKKGLLSKKPQTKTLNPNPHPCAAINPHSKTPNLSRLSLHPQPQVQRQPLSVSTFISVHLFFFCKRSTYRRLAGAFYESPLSSKAVRNHYHLLIASS